MHSSGNYVHPVDQSLGTDVANVYNAYVKSGDLTGTSATSFTSLVPFAENTGDIATLQAHAKNDDTYLNGPGTSDKVVVPVLPPRARVAASRRRCGGTWKASSWCTTACIPGTDTTPTVPQFARGRLGAETQAAYYDRPVTKFASYQRVLCNKCHAKD